MASKSLNKAFTLLEVAVSLLIFTIAMGVVVFSYLNLLRANLISQSVYSSVENLRLALEQIWREVKYGSGFAFDAASNQLTFKDLNCANASLGWDNSQGILTLTKDAIVSTLNNPALIEVKDFKVLLTPASSEVMVLSFAVAAQAKSAVTKVAVPINLQMSVAPLNAPFPTSPCP